MNIKARHMLEAGLGVLHFEAMEWIEETEFEIHELSVLGLLSNSKKTNDSATEQKHKDLILNIESCLKKLSDEFLPDLERHERYLSGLLMVEKEVKDNSYRGKHTAIAERTGKIKTEIKRLKKEIYAFLVIGHHQQRHGFPF